MKKVLQLIFPIVLIVLFHSCSPDKELSPTQEAPKERVVSTLKKAIGSSPIKLKMSAKKDTVVETVSGVKVAIKKNSFVDENGIAITGDVDISVKEAVTLNDIVTENISTVTQDGILETRGMVNLQVFQNGKELALAPNQQIELNFPKAKNENEDFGIFYGVEDSTGTMIWEPAEDPVPSKPDIIKTIAFGHEVFDELEKGEQWSKDLDDRRKLIDETLTFTEVEKRNLLYQKIEIYWILFSDGDLEVYQVSGNISNRKKKEIENKLNRIPFVKPYMREGDVAEISGVIHLSFKESSKNAAYENYYSLSTRRLGWINCDVFIKYAVPKVDMSVKASENCILKIKFKNYNTIVSGKKKHGGFYFSQLPVNEPIEIIAIDYQKDGILYSVTETSVSESTKSIAPFEKISMAELKTRLANLD